MSLIRVSNNNWASQPAKYAFGVVVASPFEENLYPSKKFLTLGDKKKDAGGKSCEHSK